jgi:hypothetical protein
MGILKKLREINNKIKDFCSDENNSDYLLVSILTILVFFASVAAFITVGAMNMEDSIEFEEATPETLTIYDKSYFYHEGYVVDTDKGLFQCNAVIVQNTIRGKTYNVRVYDRKIVEVLGLSTGDERCQV